MPQLIFGILTLLGLIYLFVIRNDKNPLDEANEKLDNVRTTSKVLNVEEVIVKEEIKQKGHVAKIEKLKGKKQ